MVRAARVACWLLFALCLVGCHSKKQAAATPEPLTTQPTPGPAGAQPTTHTPAGGPAENTTVEPRQPTDPPVKAAMTLEQLKKEFAGRTKEEFLNRFGKPDSIQTDGPDEYWYYKGLTIDPTTKEVDEREVQVSINKGIVRRFNR